QPGLRLIMQQPTAISAYDLLDLLRQVEPQAKPPTVYRGLEFLLEQGFIHKIESTNSYVLCHHFDDAEHTSVMLICDRCLSVTEKSSHKIEGAITTLAKDN
ncbi:transcriptional repressor, partial [Escherichia coli]|uniref:transcriptional repressor n=1 Tax=Escherichia coli TaxID=562 RepID=UPI00307960A9